MYFPRDIEVSLRQNLESNLILLILGARQVGKTSVLRKLYDNAIREEKKCFFFNLEDFSIRKKLDEHPFQIFQMTQLSPEEKQILFLDEIQYLQNPSNFLKLIFDTYKDSVKLIVSGSSSFYIDQKFTDSLAGRKRIFYLYPLNFREFLVFKGQQDILSHLGNISSPLYVHEAERLFDEYCLFGGYPEIVLLKDPEEKKLRLADLGYDYVKKDVLEANVDNPEKYFYLLKIFANHSGELVNIHELSNTLGLSTTAAQRYLYIMQKSFHVALIRPFWKNIRKELTKMQKVFFYDLGLRNHFLKNFTSLSERNDKGNYLENIVFRELLFRTALEDIQFWRDTKKHEVDFVVEGKNALEVKFQGAKDTSLSSQVFRKIYPNIPIKFLKHEDVLQYFYGEAESS
ncbi:ATP-binding protein [Candidatus Peregrinibacteria bacterium]|nr:ATP-binding protein [Candidatus Peregrinibacteria bacterium]